MWYLGASAFALSRNATICLPSSLGGVVVRVATGTPTSRKNFSCPAGEQMQFCEMARFRQVIVRSSLQTLNHIST